MRKLFLSMAAVAALLTSCSKDETTTAPVIERSKVTFTVNAPELSTRAEAEYGTGLTAKTLDYVIYDLAEEAGKNQITGTTTFPDGELETTVTVDLVEGREYEAIFFAHAEDAPYTINWTEQTMTINTTSLKANAESYDAFYKYVEPFVMPATGLTKDVEMTRPFAQLNVATNDFDTQAGKLIDAATTGIEVEAYNTLNFKDGTVDGKETIIYALADKMVGTIDAGGEEYSWLTMNYILVNAKENVGVKFHFTDVNGNGDTRTYTREYTAVPVQRNHKTNIIGSILTSETKFNVEINPGFETPEHDYNVDTTEETVVTTVNELQEAINNATAGTNIIKLGANITTKTTRAANDPAIVISQQEGINIIIDGDGHTYDGTIYIDGNSRHTGTETLTFTNINFKHSSGKIDFIWSDDGADGVKRYAHNVTIENCTFTGNTNGAVVGARLRQAYNVRFVNCVSGENMFSLAQLSSLSNEVTFDNVTITNNTEGINLLSSTGDVTIKNSNIKADLYGVRGEGSGELTIENSSIEAQVPVVVRYTSTFDVELLGQNTLTRSGDNAYDIIFTAGAFGNTGHFNSLTAPADDKYSITGADSYNVFPRDLVIATAEELKAFRDAVNLGNNYKGKVVKLAADIDLNNESWTPIGGDDSYVNNFAGTFDGNGFTVSNFKFDGKCAGFFGTISGGANIKNLTINGATLSGPHYAGGIVAWAEAGASSLTIENCHVKNSIITLTAEELSNGKYDNGDKAGGIIGFSYLNHIIGCSVENTTITAYRDCGGIVGYAKSGTVKNNTVKDGVKLIQNNDNNYNDYTTEEAVNFGDIVGRRAGDILEGGNSGTVTKQGGIFDGYYIDANGAYNVFNAKGLANINAMMFDKSIGRNVVVNLVSDIDFTGKTWTPVDSHADTKFTFKELNGNGHIISNLTINGQAMFKRFAGSGDVTIKDVTFDNATVNSTSINTSILTVQSYQNVLLDNVDVKNSSITGGYKVAPLIATVYNEGSSTVTATLKNCDVEKVTVKATSYDFCTAGMVAFVYADDNDKIEFENCTVKDVKLIAPDDNYDAHAAIYTTGSDSLFNEAEGVTVSNVTFEAL